MKREKIHYIIKDFKNKQGSDEHFRVYTVTSVIDGRTEVVFETTQVSRYPVDKLNEILEIADRISGGGGRKRVTTDEIIALSLHHGEVTPEPDNYFSHNVAE